MNRLFYLAALSMSLLWGATAVGQTWFGKKECASKQDIIVESRVDRYRYDASGNLGEDLWDTGLATCGLWITICGDRIFKSKVINTDAKETCPENLSWQSVPQGMVCCDEWKRAKQSKNPCDPLADIDCDGISNQEDDTPTQAGAGTEPVKKDKKGGATLHADLSVAIQAPQRFPLGVTPFVLKVHNHGPGSATAVRLIGSVGQGKLNYATTSQGNCSVSENSLSCEFDTVHPNQGRSVSIQLRTEAEGEVLITAEVTGGAPDSITANNHAEKTINVKKAVKGTIVP